MTTSFAGTALRLLAVNVTVTSCPRWSRPAGEMRSANRSLPASGEAITRCMSSASGAIARFVIEAPEPSMKKRTPEKRPTPSVTPTSAAAVRRGLRNRSRRTYLASIGGGELLLYDLAVAQAHRPAPQAGGRRRSPSSPGRGRRWVRRQGSRPGGGRAHAQPPHAAADRLRAD